MVCRLSQIQLVSQLKVEIVTRYEPVTFSLTKYTFINNKKNPSGIFICRRVVRYKLSPHLIDRMVARDTKHF